LILLCAVYSIQGRSLTTLEDEPQPDFTFIPTTENLANLQVKPEYVKENTHFFLWTRQRPTKLYQLKTGDETNLKESGYDKTLPTKIFAHGFEMNGYDNEEVLKVRDEYLKHEDCNFISVDWQKLAGGINYMRAVSSSTIVGELTGQLINFLLEQGADLNNFHVIGFSLGAHVAGKAGATANGLVPRITGLDPAYPLFSMENTDQRLDTTDAEFVDVIHTNSGNLIHASLSFPQPIGHADFFVNGGHSQPGCGLIISGGIYDLLGACSHSRAPAYFTESINSPVGFKSTLCTSWDNFKKGHCAGNTSQLMGEPISKSARGVFYLTTNKKSPFALKA